MAEIAGLKLIVPSSVAGSGVSVSASGKVSFSSSATISVNGVFDSTYDNYLIVMRGDISAGQQIEMRVRASGTDATGSNYARQFLRAVSTTVSGGRGTSLATGYIGILGASQRGGFHIYVYGPALAQPTAWRSVSASDDGGASITDEACTHSLSTAYDGFTIGPIPGAPTLTGSLTVYGLSN
jgi:hypothetical protein